MACVECGAPRGDGEGRGFVVEFHHLGRGGLDGGECVGCEGEGLFQICSVSHFAFDFVERYACQRCVCVGERERLCY